MNDYIKRRLEEFREKFPEVECSAHERTSSAFCICEDLADINEENMKIKSFLAVSIHQAEQEMLKKVVGMIESRKPNERVVREYKTLEARTYAEKALVIEALDDLFSSIKSLLDTPKLEQ